MPLPRLDALAKTILKATIHDRATDCELLIVITMLQDHLLERVDDRALRAVLGRIISTENDADRAGFLADFLMLGGDSSYRH